MSLLLLFAGAARITSPLPRRMGVVIAEASPRARMQSATPVATVSDRTPIARAKRGNPEWT